jgi:glyoxylase-like metal-dependent hydrolase (beta-lactamase superfamily II)
MMANASHDRVVPLLDGVMDLDTLGAFPQTSMSDWAVHKEFLSPSGRLVMPYGGFLIPGSSNRNTLVDVGGGPAFEVPAESGELVRSGLLPDALERLGVTPGEIDTVVLTHLHIDHIGWLGPDGAPFFPNAEIYCHRADWDYFVDTPSPPDARIPDWLSGCDDRIRLWDGDRITIGDLVLRHVPGHTPGSIVVMLSAQGNDDAVIGDLVHSPVEFLEQWDGLADADPKQAASSRHSIKSEFTASATTVWGTHFPAMLPGQLAADPANGITWAQCC